MAKKLNDEELNKVEGGVSFAFANRVSNRDKGNNNNPKKCYACNKKPAFLIYYNGHSYCDDCYVQITKNVGGIINKVNI